MRTFAYALIAVGFIILAAASRGRKFTDLPGDLRDLSVALVTFDQDAMSEVLSRKDEPISTVSAFQITDMADKGRDILDQKNSGSDKTVNDLLALGVKLHQMGFKVSENKRLGDNPKPGTHLATGYHYKFDNSGAIDVNWPNAAEEAKRMDALAPALRRMGFHVLWRVKGHYNHLHVDISRKDI